MKDLELEALLAAHSFVQGMRPEHLRVLLHCAKVISFEPDHLIFKEGEPANEFYLIEKGKVALEAHEPAGSTVTIREVGADDAVGWSWMLPPFVWHLSARTIEPTTVIALNGAHLLVRAENDPEFGYQLMKRVATIVMHRLQAARSQLLANETDRLLYA